MTPHARSVPPERERPYGRAIGPRPAPTRWRSGRPARRRRGLLAVGCAVLLSAALGCSAGAPPPIAVPSEPEPLPPGDATTLGAAAARTGRTFGTAVAAHKLDDPVYAEILAQEFTSVTPENELKWESTQPQPGVFQFAAAEQIVARAQQLGVPVRGHTLVWHSQLPPWVEQISSPDELRAAMRTHITEVVTHFRGVVKTWDVVNEAFADGGGVLGGGLRESIWPRLLGYDTGWIEEAFRAAREADPSATLCYNDYNIDDWWAAKTRNVYAMVADFKARGVPIDCVGLQSHFNPASPVPSSYRKTIEEFAALGVEVQITELDIAGSGEAQATDYLEVVQACLAVPQCTAITVWGIRDSDSWRAETTPLLFDADGRPKPAHGAVLGALNTEGVIATG